MDDIISIRDRDVAETFFDAIKGTMEFSVRQDEIIRRLADGRAPRFYVSYEKARRFVSMLERGLELPLKNPNRIRMYEELHRRYRMRVSVTGRKEGYMVLSSIIEEPAPSFYMEPKTFRAIVYKYHHSRTIKCR